MNNNGLCFENSVFEKVYRSYPNTKTFFDSLFFINKYYLPNLHPKLINKLLLFGNTSIDISDGLITDLEKLINDRIPKDETGVFQKAKNIINNLKTDWLSQINTVKQSNIGKSEKDKIKLKYKDLIGKSQKQEQWSLMNSMREVDTNSIIEISLNQTTTINNEKEDVEQK